MVRATCALAFLLLGCSASPLPGTVLGTYKATGQSTANTCGLGAPDPWTFDVQLSLSDQTLYWSWMDGSPLLSGPLNAQSQASLTDTKTGNVDGTDSGLGPCTLQRSDNLEVALGAGTPPNVFAATVGYSFSVTSGSDCSDQLMSSGGMYQTLPCSVSYTVAASHR